MFTTTNELIRARQQEIESQARQSAWRIELQTYRPKSGRAARAAPPPALRAEQAMGEAIALGRGGFFDSGRDRAQCGSQVTMPMRERPQSSAQRPSR